MYKRTQQDGTKSLVYGPTVCKNKPIKENVNVKKKERGAVQGGGGVHVKCVYVYFKINSLNLSDTDLRNCTCLKI